MSHLSQYLTAKVVQVSEKQKVTSKNLMIVEKKRIEDSRSFGVFL